eukprot:gene1408-4574_t
MTTNVKQRPRLAAATDTKWFVLAEDTPSPISSASTHTNHVQCITWSLNNKFVATGGLDGKIVVSSMDTSSTIPIIDEGEKKPIHTLAFAKSTGILAYGSGQGTISMFDVGAKRVVKTINGFNAAIMSLGFDKGSEQLVFGDRLGNVGLYSEFEETTSHLQRGPSAAVCQICFANEKRNLAAAALEDGMVNVYDTARSGHVNKFKHHSSQGSL